MIVERLEHLGEAHRTGPWASIANRNEFLKRSPRRWFANASTSAKVTTGCVTRLTHPEVTFKDVLAFADQRRGLRFTVTAPTAR